MTHDTLIGEQIKVWAFFDAGIFPIAISWRRRLIKFEKLVFSSTKKIGEVKIVSLICASGTAIYELEYNSGNYLWNLKRISS